MNINYDEPIKNLPDAYAKDTDSNNYKLLQTNKVTTDAIRAAKNAVFDVMNINNATGAALDDIWGGKLNLKRNKGGTESDEHYKLRLCSKMMQDISDGTFVSVVKALAFTLNCNSGDIYLTESESQNKVKIISIPLDAVSKAGFTTDEITEMIEKMLPVGVHVDSENYTGTFEYSDINEDDINGEYDESAGYADTEQTIGGYYGLLGS